MATVRAGAWRAPASTKMLMGWCTPSSVHLPRPMCHVSTGAGQARVATQSVRGAAGAAVDTPIANSVSSGAAPRGPVPRPREGVSRIGLKSLQKRLELLQLPHEVRGHFFLLWITRIIFVRMIGRVVVLSEHASVW